MMVSFGCQRAATGCPAIRTKGWQNQVLALSKGLDENERKTDLSLRGSTLRVAEF